MDIWFWFGDRKLAEEQLKKAELLEVEGDFKEACYSYALALHLKTTNPDLCRQKIVDLWQNHGPFDYSYTVQELKEHKNECGLAGHERVMGFIKKAIENAKNSK